MVTNKRKLFDELIDGVESMGKHRQGKLTLRTYNVESLPVLEVDADLIRQIREVLGVSRGVFARYLRVSLRTLENWEQGRTKPNSQAAALILLVHKYPDTLEKLGSLNNLRKISGDVGESAQYGTDKRKMPVSGEEVLMIGNYLPVSLKSLNELSRRFYIKRLVLFGSAARQRLEPKSDVDLMVEFETGKEPSIGG